MVEPWQLCRTIGPLMFHSQEIVKLTLAEDQDIPMLGSNIK